MEHGMLVGYFDKRDQAERAWRGLRRQGHHGLVLATRTAAGKVQVRDSFP